MPLRESIVTQMARYGMVASVGNVLITHIGRRDAMLAAFGRLLPA